ncbi:unnamed protein product [Gongylonema pulchrum]|uniref:Uncharacterized protein n=1 Tax=Gongylonema pulchrum TaxID=637853 RepID=A0A183CU80_9BILA|nr:unnamed protein product [Gongylonema pulchrum]
MCSEQSGIACAMTRATAGCGKSIDFGYSSEREAPLLQRKLVALKHRFYKAMLVPCSIGQQQQRQSRGTGSGDCCFWLRHGVTTMACFWLL